MHVSILLAQSLNGKLGVLQTEATDKKGRGGEAGFVLGVACWERRQADLFPKIALGYFESTSRNSQTTRQQDQM